MANEAPVTRPRLEKPEAENTTIVSSGETGTEGSYQTNTTPNTAAAVVVKANPAASLPGDVIVDRLVQQLWGQREHAATPAISVTQQKSGSPYVSAAPATSLYGISAPLPSVHTFVQPRIEHGLSQSCPPASFCYPPTTQVPDQWRQQRSESFCSTIPDDLSMTAPLTPDTVTSATLEDCFSPIDIPQPFANGTDSSMPSPPTVPDNGDSLSLADDPTFFMNPQKVLVEPLYPEYSGFNLQLTAQDGQMRLPTSPSTGDVSIQISRQPPGVYRARYNTETTQTMKGQLRDQQKEPIAITLENPPDTCSDVTVKITTKTIRDKPHPTMTPFCFGKSMPKDWKVNKEDNSVTTKLEKKENYFKKLGFLAITRNKMDGVDTSKYDSKELSSFKIQFDVDIPLPGGGQKRVSQTTKPVQAVCPNKMTRIRKQRNGSQAVSPSKKRKCDV